MSPTPPRQVHLRFFCGPNAHKSEALAKQQKKRPRGDGGSTAGAGSSKDDAIELEDDEDDDEDGKALLWALIVAVCLCSFRIESILLLTLSPRG